MGPFHFTLWVTHLSIGLHYLRSTLKMQSNLQSGFLHDAYYLVIHVPRQFAYLVIYFFIRDSPSQNYLHPRNTWNLPDPHFMLMRGHVGPNAAF